MDELPRAAGQNMHLCALLYMTDMYVLDTPLRTRGFDIGYGTPDTVEGEEPATATATTTPATGQATEASPPPSPSPTCRVPDDSFRASLSHTVYVHAPAALCASEWLYYETSSPWASDGRVLISSRIFTRSGVLVATSYQEVS